jgi:hypothetical protein
MIDQAGPLRPGTENDCCLRRGEDFLRNCTCTCKLVNSAQCHVDRLPRLELTCKKACLGWK